MRRWLAGGILSAWLTFGAIPAQAADIELWTARAIATVLAETGTVFERATGHRLHVRTGLPADFEARLAAGERFDVVVSSVKTVERWIEQGRLMSQSRVDLARSGIADAVRAKTTRPDTDSVCELVAAGKVDLGMVVITQILTTPGVELAGPLPEEIQAKMVFAGAVGRNSKAPEAAAQLLAFLRGPVAAPVFKAQAMEQDF